MDKSVDAERRFADAQAANLPQESHERWLACRSTHKFHTFVNKELIVFNLLFDNPNMLDTFRCIDLTFTRQAGFRSSWLSASGTTVHVGHAPFELYEGCFLWHPSTSKVEFYMHKGKPSLRMQMMYRTATNPNNHEEGAVYMLEKAVLEDLLAQVANAK